MSKMLENITPVVLTYNEEPNIVRTFSRLCWANDVVVVDSGSSDTPPVTTDKTFDLSLSGDTDANGIASVVYQEKLNGGAWTDLPSSSLSNLADGDYQFQAIVTDKAGNSSGATTLSMSRRASSRRSSGGSSNRPAVCM